MSGLGLGFTVARPSAAEAGKAALTVIRRLAIAARLGPICRVDPIAEPPHHVMRL
jgi:hypothetical protein